MKRLPLDWNLAPWKRLRGRKILFAFDYDGTLSPIVLRHEDAYLPETTRKLLKAVARREKCAIVTGRKIDDIEWRLGGAKIVGLVGNHGLEWPRQLRGLGATRKLVSLWKEKLSGLAGEGIEVEDKRYSLTIHYRKAADEALAKRRIRRALRGLTRLRVVGGKKVFNLTVKGSPDKGWAVARLVREHRCHAALYVGDDVTDEDVFRRRNGILGVRVGKKASSRASYYLKEQSDIDELLGFLARCR